MANIAAIDCDQESNKPLCGKYGIQGFPTIKVMTPKKGKNGKRTFSTDDYKGQRTVKAISDFVTSVMPSTVQKLTSDSLPAFLQKQNETAKVLLFTKKGTTSAIYKALSTSFFEGVVFGQVRENQKEVVETFGISSFPTLLVLPGGAQPKLVHSGDMKLESLKEFVTSALNQGFTEQTTEGGDPKIPTGESKCPLGHDKASGTAADIAPKTPGQENASAPPPTLLETVKDFVDSCLQSGAKPALLTPKGLLSNRYASKMTEFSFFEYSTQVADYMSDKLKITLGTTGLFLNGKKGWFILSPEDMHSAEDAIVFLDKVKQGEAGKKIKFTPPSSTSKTEL